jgi:hypothetical protein
LKLGRLSKDWKAMVYAFYDPTPRIIYINDRRCHEFSCGAQGCKYNARRFLDTKDRASTSNMIKHTRRCWGELAWEEAGQCRDAAEARTLVTDPITSSGSVSFEQKGINKTRYSNKELTKSQSKLVVIFNRSSKFRQLTV